MYAIIAQSAHSAPCQNIGKVNIQSCNIILKKTKLFYNYQFGFRKNHLTRHATSLLIENIAETFENKEHVLIIVFLDLSKAVVLKLFAPAAHFATFPNFAAHLDQSADLCWSALSFPRFPLPDALQCIT